mmetsp:Transcript_62187/g.196278  ORF Transcript_62187/g.196278 Transcript_62187/m.196278 type:complete len:80 (+) Transcript_62187:531-770(+)
MFFDKHFPGPAPAQYKSAIWYHDDEQKRAAERLLKQQGGEAAQHTDLQPAVDFHAAEDYHQGYYSKMRGGSLSMWGDSL